MRFKIAKVINPVTKHTATLLFLIAGIILFMGRQIQLLPYKLCD